MSRPVSKKIDVFLNVNRSTINDYFSPHDSAPIYKRQLRHDLITYLNESVTTYARYTQLRYKVSCNKEDKDLVDPFITAVRRHFTVKEQLTYAKFERFKKRSFRLLIVSLVIVMVCHGLLPLLFSGEFGETVMNSVDIFSWVILWQPIERLVFLWNPYLKEISLYNKLANAEVIIMEYASAALEVETKTKLRASA
jgi:hypothetical protein